MVDLLQKAYVLFAFNCVSYDRQQTATTTAKVAANVAEKVAEKKSCVAPQAKSSQARLLSAQESINDVEKVCYDSLGTWSDDEDIDAIDEERDVDICEEKVKELINQEFPVKFRAWRNRPTAVVWSKADDKVIMRDGSALYMFELVRMASEDG